MFKERANPRTSVEVVKEFIPRIGITGEALTKMSIYVKECSDEIGWLGTAYKNVENNTIFIDDVYLFDQDVHGATTEITPEGLSQFAEELLSQGDAGIEIWNNLKMWGHSHVNMDVFPSGQDNSQMKTFKEGGHDWFIRLICNKKGEMKLDLYDYETGVVYTDLPWVEIPSEEEREITRRIDELYALLDAQAKKRLDTYQGVIKEEMKQKVRKMHARTLNTPRITNLSGGKYVNGKWVYDEGDKKKQAEQTTAQTTTKDSQNQEQKASMSSGQSTMTNTKDTESTIDRSGYYDEIDTLENDFDVAQYFSLSELLELSVCERWGELEDMLEDLGYFNFFTQNDIERIWRVMTKVRRDSINDGIGY